MLGTCGPAQKTSNGGQGRMVCGTSTINAQARWAPGASSGCDCVPQDRPRPENARLHLCVTRAGTQLRPDPCANDDLRL